VLQQLLHQALQKFGRPKRFSCFPLVENLLPLPKPPDCTSSFSVLADLGVLALSTCAFSVLTVLLAPPPVSGPCRSLPSLAPSVCQVGVRLPAAMLVDVQSGQAHLPLLE